MPIDPRTIFYKGKHVLLKTLDEQDVAESNWAGWFNDAAMCEFNQHHYWPNSVSAQRQFLASCAAPGKLQLGIVAVEAPERICGVVSLNAIDLLHRHADIAGIHETGQTRSNSAIFLESWSFMLRHGFEELGLNKIHGGTFHPHVPGALARAFNFEIEGVRRRHVFKRNGWHDLTMVAVFADTVRYPEL